MHLPGTIAPSSKVFPSAVMEGVEGDGKRSGAQPIGIDAMSTSIVKQQVRKEGVALAARSRARRVAAAMCIAARCFSFSSIAYSQPNGRAYLRRSALSLGQLSTTALLNCPLLDPTQVPYHPGQDDSAHAGPYGPPVKEGLEVDVESVEYDENGRVRLDKRKNVTLAAGRCSTD